MSDAKAPSRGSNLPIHSVRPNTSIAIEHYPAAGRAWSMLAMLVIAYMTSLIDRQIPSLMVGSIRADLGIGDFEMGLLQGTAFAVFYCGFGIPLGRIADRTNRKNLIAAGIFLWSIMTMLCGFANTFTMLFSARLGVGVGEATLLPAAYSLLSDSFPPRRLIRASSLLTVGGMLGTSVAFLVGGPIIEHVVRLRALLPFWANFRPWQLVFLVVGSLGIPLAVLICFTSSEPVRLKAEPAPSLRLGIRYLWCRRRDFAPFYLCNALLAVATYGTWAWFPSHLIRVFGLSPGQVGMALGLLLLVGIMLGPIGGALVAESLMKRGHLDAHIRTGLIISLLMLPVALVSLIGSLSLALTLFALFAIVQGSYFGVFAAALQTMTPNRLRATNSSVFVLFNNLAGLALGTALIGGLADLLFRGNRHGIGYALAIVSGCAVLLSVLVASTALRSGRCHADPPAHA